MVGSQVARVVAKMAAAAAAAVEGKAHVQVSEVVGLEVAETAPGMMEAEVSEAGVREVAAVVEEVKEGVAREGAALVVVSSVEVGVGGWPGAASGRQLAQSVAGTVMVDVAAVVVAVAAVVEVVAVTGMMAGGSAEAVSQAGAGVAETLETAEERVDPHLGRPEAALVMVKGVREVAGTVVVEMAAAGQEVAAMEAVAQGVVG